MFQAQLLGMIAEERYKDSRRQAERDRLARLASASEEHHQRNSRALALIRGKLAEWSNGLQKRQGDKVTDTLQIASDAR